MTFPVAIPFGPWRLHPHLVFESLAYLLGFRLFLLLRTRRGDSLSEATRYSVIAGAAVGAALGSKLLHLLQEPTRTLAYGDALAYFVAGKSIVGGLLGGLIGVELAKGWIGETRSTGDLFVLPLCLGIAVGRIGCFLTGLADHTYGIPTSLPWGIDFGDGVARHPTQLYEIAFLMAVAAWATYARGRLQRSGDLFRGFMTLYLAWRFAVDFIKPDVREYAGLSGIQVACLLGLVYYARDVPRVFARRDAPSGTTRP